MKTQQRNKKHNGNDWEQSRKMLKYYVRHRVHVCQYRNNTVLILKTSEVNYSTESNVYIANR